MTHLEVATLSIRTGAAAAAPQGIEQYMDKTSGQGALCAVWTAEIGALNRIIMVRAFAAREAMFAEREQIIGFSPLR